MQLSKAILVCFATSVMTLAAHATPIQYTITGDGSQLTGTVMADSGGIYSGTVTFNDGTKSYTFSGNSEGGGTAFGTYIYGQWQDSSGNELLIYATPGNDVLCSTATPCTVAGPPPFGNITLNTKLILYPNNDTFTANSGSLSTGVTDLAPEPSSLVLLGTGLLGVVAAGQRRLRRA
jgi:uncharacterized protein (DUF2147 family)